MSQDHADVVVRPPLLWLLTVIAGLGLNYSIPLSFFPEDWPNRWIGGIVFLSGLAIAFWAFRQFENFRSDVDTQSATTSIIDKGPFGISRNPIYLGMLLGLLGIAIAANTLWIAILLVIWLPVMHWGVIIREETYLEAKFDEDGFRFVSASTLFKHIPVARAVISRGELAE